jgi:hypothetical protein
METSIVRGGQFVVFLTAENNPPGMKLCPMSGKSGLEFEKAIISRTKASTHMKYTRPFLLVEQACLM